MKKWLRVLLTLAFMLSVLSACALGGSDGVNVIYVPITDKTGSVNYLSVTDGWNSNEIYIDLSGRQIYCGLMYEDSVITLPIDSVHGKYTGKYDLSVEYVCKLGQKQFNSDLVVLGANVGQ